MTDEEARQGSGPVSSDDALPCPWCRMPAARYDRFDHAVYCGACGASGPVLLTEHEAVASWNNREDHWHILCGACREADAELDQARAELSALRAEVERKTKALELVAGLYSGVDPAGLSTMARVVHDEVRGALHPQPDEVKK